MEPARIQLEPSRIEGDQLTVAARLEHPDGRGQRLWWRLPAEWSDAVTTWADPFVVAFLFPMMQWRGDVVVEGRVSPSLLANLETFMAIWHAWMPEKYQPVQIRAREEVEAPPPAEPGQTIMPFSGGLDSCFAVFRHRRGLMGRRNRRITAGVVMNGFDIWLDQANAPAMYDGMLEGARVMLDSVGVACIPMASNFHELPIVWAHSFGTHLVAGVRLLASRFDTMLIANGTPCTSMFRPAANHPVAIPHLSSRFFQVVDDGAEAHRPQKAQLVSGWPEAMRHLRVCFANPGSHANCCRCEKCVRTILEFRAAGCPLPPAFRQDVTDRRIRRTRLFRECHYAYWPHIASAARERGLGGTGWARACRAAIRRNRLRRALASLKRPFIPLRNRIRVLFRGSALSRRELAAQAATDDRRTGPATEVNKR